MSLLKLLANPGQVKSLFSAGRRMGSVLADSNVEDAQEILKIARKAEITPTGPKGDVIEIVTKKGKKKNYRVQHQGDVLFVRGGLNHFSLSAENPPFSSPMPSTIQLGQKLQSARIAEKAYRKAKKEMVAKGDFEGLIRAYEAQKEKFLRWAEEDPSLTELAGKTISRLDRGIAFFQGQHARTSSLG